MNIGNYKIQLTRWLIKQLASPYLAIFFIITISVFYLQINGWAVKDYYFDREKAQIAVDKSYDGTYSNNLIRELDLLTNKKFLPVNRSYNALTFSFMLLLLLIILKVNSYEDFIKLPALSNKIIIFSWINVSYILFSYLFIAKLMNDIVIEVLPSTADSLSIPELSAAVFLFIIAIPYYIFTNLFFFITYRKTYNMKVALNKSLLFYKPLLSWKYGFITLFHIFSIILCLFLLIDWLQGKFYLSFSIQIILSFIWIYLNISALSVLANKFISSTEKQNNTVI